MCCKLYLHRKSLGWKTALEVKLLNFLLKVGLTSKQNLVTQALPTGTFYLHTNWEIPFDSGPKVFKDRESTI